MVDEDFTISISREIGGMVAKIDNIEKLLQSYFTDRKELQAQIDALKEQVSDLKVQNKNYATLISIAWSTMISGVPILMQYFFPR